MIATDTTGAEKQLALATARAERAARYARAQGYSATASRNDTRASDLRSMLEAVRGGCSPSHEVRYA